MEEQNSENVQADQASAPAKTGDGSQPAGSQDQAERPSEAAMRKTAGDQDQAGSGNRDQAGSQGGNEELIRELAETLRKVFLDLTTDQHDETTKALLNLKGLVLENRAKNEIMLQHNRQILQQSIATTDALADFAATNEKILSTIESIGALVTAISKLTQEIHGKITQ